MSIVSNTREDKIELFGLQAVKVNVQNMARRRLKKPNPKSKACLVSIKIAIKI